MPQPLSRMLKGDYNITWDAEAAFDKHPDLALLVAKCVFVWPQVESNLSRFLTDLLGANAKVAMAMFGSLNSTAAQRDAVTAAADVSLPIGHEARPFFEAALKSFTTQAKRRNKFAHHIWGLEASLPNCLILTEPKVLSDLAVKHKEPILDAPGDIDVEDWMNSRKPDLSSIFVYTRIDLEAHLRDFKQAAEAWHLLAMLVSDHPSQWSPLKDEARRRLSALPLFAGALRP